MASDRHILRADNVTKIYGGRKVVNRASVQVEQGNIVGLLGPNGAGKTTTFYMMVGLIRPDEGRIYLDDRDITSAPMFRRGRMGISYLAQEPSVFRKLTVEENILAILEYTEPDRRRRKARLEALIEEFGLGRVRRNRGELLSGGERRDRPSPGHQAPLYLAGRTLRRRGPHRRGRHPAHRGTLEIPQYRRLDYRP